MPDNLSPPLTPAEQKYFDTGGQSDPGAASDAAPVIVPDAPQPAPDAQADPATPGVADAPVAPHPQQNAPRTVPVEALSEERERRRKAEERYQRDIGKLTERLDTLQRIATAQPQADAPKVPSWDEAPLDAGRATTARVEATAAELQRMRQDIDQRNNFENFRNAYAAQAADYTGKQTDFPEAYRHFTSSLAGELNAAGYTDPAFIAAEVQRMELAIAGKAMQDGVNPAERIYAVAKLRGYAQRQAAPIAAAQPAAQPQADAAAQLRTLAGGQTAARSLASSGAPTDPNLSLKKLLEMDDDEFGKMDEKTWRRVMGAERP